MKKIILSLFLILIFFTNISLAATNTATLEAQIASSDTSGAVIANYAKSFINSIQDKNKLIKLLNALKTPVNTTNFTVAQKKTTTLLWQFMEKITVDRLITLYTSGGSTATTTSSTTTGGSSTASASNAGTLKIAVLGDGAGKGVQKQGLLKHIAAFGAELVIFTGDFNASPDTRESMLNADLPANIAFIGTIGNHDRSNWSGFDSMLNKRVANNPNLKCTGTLGKKSICNYKGIDIVTAAPGLGGGDGAYIQQVLANSKATWKLCNWHYNQTKMQLGRKSNSAGWSVYEEARKGGCITLNGHDHAYGRTYLLDNMESQHVINNTKGPYLIKPGQTVHLLVGSSGKSSLYRTGSAYGAPYWAVNYAKGEWDKGNGVLLCTINGRNMHCDFKTSSGQISDSFDLTSGN